MIYVLGYIATLLVFGIIDAAWLTTMGSVLYKPTLGDILTPSIRIGPAIAFYLIFPIGILIFGALPAARATSLATALLYGALFGAFAYGTYDLTNYATLRNWTAQITLIDIVYGAIASAIASGAGYYALRAAGNWIGQSPS
ncbi:MAG: DUF2177 family protein [Methylobacteriaceae bacterium]|nr:DUF2177 family protein [Methylobacteriaceae bacterium]